MNQNEPNLERGLIRSLHPSEIAYYVKFCREKLKLKQTILAAEAGITERTLQRIESGQKVDDTTLDKIALALKFEKGSLTEPRYISTIEEVIENSQKYFEERSNKYEVINIKPLQNESDIDAIILSEAYLVDDQNCPSSLKESTAIFKDLLTDWNFIYGDLANLERLNACKDLLEHIKSIAAKGFIAKYGIYDCIFDNKGTKLKTAVIQFIDKLDRHHVGMTQAEVLKTATNII
ncbi:MAG: helix-turn-helix transcriptional regulator [Gammaproteobacteria bacterium]|nr:helix-turn-helix transcriptional regulator [Gammaproteobacteria bacterium]